MFRKDPRGGLAGATPRAGARAETRTTAAHTGTYASAHGVGHAWGEVALARHASAGHTHDTKVIYQAPALTVEWHAGPPPPASRPHHTHTHICTSQQCARAVRCSQRARAAARAASLPWRAVGVSTHRHGCGTRPSGTPRRAASWGSHAVVRTRKRKTRCGAAASAHNREGLLPALTRRTKDIDDKHTSVTCV